MHARMSCTDTCIWRLASFIRASVQLLAHFVIGDDVEAFFSLPLKYALCSWNFAKTRGGGEVAKSIFTCISIYRVAQNKPATTDFPNELCIPTVGARLDRKLIMQICINYLIIDHEASSVSYFSNKKYWNDFCQIVR